MAAIEIFSRCVNYRYKNRICSLSTFIVLLFITLSLLTPFFIIYNAGGFWLKSRIHAEPPDIRFGYKYLLFAESDYNINPIICSTFATYKENKITDDCVLVKVKEIDTNSDGRKDILKFEAQFYADKAVKSLKLLLFFNFTLKQLLEATIESIAVFDYTLNQEIQSIKFFGDLELHQKGLLRSEGLYQIYNHSIEFADYSLSELLLENANKKFSARISNQQILWQAGYSSQEVVTIQGELFYTEHLIYYQPSVWEELKWAWVQYLSTFLVFAYLTKHILMFLFTNKYINSYIVVPWKDK